MSVHGQIYDQYFGIDVHNPRMCELLGYQGKKVEIHHIDARGMGGRPSADHIKNLMCLHARAHQFYGDKDWCMDWLIENHLIFMECRTPLMQRNPADRLLMKLTDWMYEPKSDSGFYFEKGRD